MIFGTKWCYTIFLVISNVFDLQTGQHMQHIEIDSNTSKVPNVEAVVMPIGVSFPVDR